MARSALRRFERLCLGVAFGVIAWVIERRVLKAIRRKGLAPPGKTTLADQSTSELRKPSA